MARKISVIIVGRVLTLDQESEHLLVRGSEQVVRALAILQSEECVAVFGPPLRLFERLARQERRKMHFLEARGVHFFANDSLNVAVHQIPEWQPREYSGCHASYVATAHQQSVAWYLGVSRVLAKGPKEQ